MPAFMTFDSNEVCELVGIGPLLLNKFVERRTHGIQPSVRSGKGRGGRRLFSPNDVFGIALVWWLFESGLRSGVIEYILNQICASANGNAAEAAKKLVGRKIRVVRVRTTPRELDRGRRRLKKPEHLVDLIIVEDPRATRHVSIDLEIPVGHFYFILVDKMKKLTGLPEGE